MSPTGPAPSLARDSRGAIMIMGVFMAALLVAVMWYLAGLGDALLFRERAQEAADAAAFSASALQARGMHVLVLLNLTMAMILAVRVALKAIWTLATIASVIFGVICAIPLIGTWACPIESLAVSAATYTQTALQATRAPIDAALRALNVSATVVGHAIPPAAVAASLEVGRKYRDGVKLTVAISDPMTEVQGLPVEDGSTTKLCGEAGKAIGSIISVIFGRTAIAGKLGDFIGNALSGLVESAPAYFCELPGMPNSPLNLDQFAGQIDDAAEQHCNGQRDTAVKAAEDKATAAGKDSVKAGNDARGKFDFDKCKIDKKNRTTNQITTGTASAGAGGKGAGKIAPMRLSAEGGNYCSVQQSIGVAEGNHEILKKGPHMVSLGYSLKGPAKTSTANAILPKLGAVAPDAFAQSEYFYDCAGSFEGRDCNDDEEAMWHFHWRPRLRLWNAPFDGIKLPVAAIETIYRAKVTLDLGGSAGHIVPENAALMQELGRTATSSPDVFIH